MYRSVQEALHNISKHSAAKNFSVNLQGSAQKLSLQVNDDGVGFSPKTASVESFGLAGMRDRVKDLGGTLKVQSTKDGGTRIQIEIPVKGAELRKVQIMVPNAGAKAS